MLKLCLWCALGVGIGVWGVGPGVWGGVGSPSPVSSLARMEVYLSGDGEKRTGEQKEKQEEQRTNGNKNTGKQSSSSPNKLILIFIVIIGVPLGLMLRRFLYSTWK
jgi:hypothetical protein